MAIAWLGYAVRIAIAWLSYGWRLSHVFNNTPGNRVDSSTNGSTKSEKSKTNTGKNGQRLEKLVPMPGGKKMNRKMANACDSQWQKMALQFATAIATAFALVRLLTTFVTGASAERMNVEKSNPMADFVDVIKEHWWQGTAAPIASHHVGKDLSVVKALLRQGWDREELLGALGEYTGPPATLLVIYSRGRRNIINELAGRWRKKQQIDKTAIANILKSIINDSAHDGILDC